MTVTINGTTGYSGPVGTIGDLTTTGNTTLGDASGDTLTINGSTTTLTQGTANGVAYLNASKVLTTGSALVFDGTNLGIGVTSPTAKLTLSGNQSFVEKTNAYLGVDVATSSGNGGSFTLKAGGGLGAGNTAGNLYLGAGRGGSSASSGAIYFGISQSTNAVGLDSTLMTLDASGNLGIGTTSPSQKLHVEASTSATIRLVATGTQTGHITSDSSGFTFNSLSSAPVIFSTANTERARIDSSGNLLVGTTTAVSKLTVAGNSVFVGTSVTGGRYAGFSNGTAGQECYVGNYQAIMGAGSSEYALIYSTNRVYALASTGGVYVATNGTSWTSASDERLKDIIEPISDAANKVSTLRAVIGKYKTDEEGIRRSFLIAQDVQAVLPEAVDSSNPDELGVQYTEVIPLLVAAIKEQQAIIESLKARLDAANL